MGLPGGLLIDTFRQVRNWYIRRSPAQVQTAHQDPLAVEHLYLPFLEGHTHP